jgi:hypothetical protein
MNIPSWAAGISGVYQPLLWSPDGASALFWNDQHHGWKDSVGVIDEMFVGLGNAWPAVGIAIKVQGQ